MTRLGGSWLRRVVGAGQKRRNLRGPSYLRLLRSETEGIGLKAGKAYTRAILKVNADGGIHGKSRSLEPHQVQRDLLVSVLGGPEVEGCRCDFVYDRNGQAIDGEVDTL